MMSGSGRRVAEVERAFFGSTCMMGARPVAFAAGVRQKAEVTDATEPFRQHVEQKAADELIYLERHHLGVVVGAIILPTEPDATALASEEPTVSDRDTMGVAPEIFEDLLRATEGT